MQQKLPSINFEKVPGRKENLQTYSVIDATHTMLFPESLSTNNKIHVDISFDKALGRSEHGMNLQRRKVNRRGISNLQTAENNQQENISTSKFRSIATSVQKMNQNSSKILEQIRLREQNIKSKLEKPAKSFTLQEINKNKRGKKNFSVHLKSLATGSQMSSNKNRLKSPEAKFDKAISPTKINVALEGHRVFEVMPSFSHYHEDGDKSAEMKYH